ncbi:hypothetical protein A2U01_0078199, partial [Trifolium medium]|nr:hypothetical protein [Trifolium medium]
YPSAQPDLTTDAIAIVAQHRGSLLCWECWTRT